VGSLSKYVVRLLWGASSDSVTDGCSLVILVSRIEVASNDESMQSIWTEVGEGALPSSSHDEIRTIDGGRS
jgi:hypothetical protein